MEKIKVGVIGFGSIGKYHLRAYKKIPNVEVVAVCDIDKKELKVAKNEYGIENLYTDYHDLLAREDIDAVSVCLPNRLHSIVTIEALKQGKHVLTEKPPAITTKEVKEMFETSKKYGKKLMVELTSRFKEKTRTAKKLIEKGALGGVYYARCGCLRRSGIPGYGSWFTTKSEAGSGPLFDIGVHALDLTFWLMNDFKSDYVVGSTYAKFGPRGKGKGEWGKPIPGGPFNVEDFASAYIKMQSGATIYLEVSWASHLGGDRFYSIILGDKGGLDYENMMLFTEEDDILIDKKILYRKNDPYLAALSHFIECIVYDKEPITTRDQMVWLQATLESALISAEKNEPVKVSTLV